MPGSADEAGAAEEECRPLLFSIGYGMTGSVGDAEDIAQDASLGLTRLATMDRQLRAARNAALATLNPLLSRRLARRLSLPDYRRHSRP